MRIVSSWVIAAASGIIWVAAWLVRSRQRIELINMIGVARVADRAGLARFAGNILYAMGAVVGVAGLAFARSGFSEDAIAMVFVVVILALTFGSTPARSAT